MVCYGLPIHHKVFRLLSYYMHFVRHVKVLRGTYLSIGAIHWGFNENTNRVSRIIVRFASRLVSTPLASLLGGGKGRKEDSESDRNED